MRILYIILGIFLWLCIPAVLIIGAFLGYLAADIGGGLLCALGSPVILFIIGIFFMQLGGFFEQLFTAFSATKYVMWRNILMGIFCIAAYYFMIQKYQFYGAKITRVITSFPRIS